MPHFASPDPFPQKLVRLETGAAAAALLADGWKELPLQPTPASTWNGDQWNTPTPAEPDYLAFWDAVLVSSAYAALLGAAMSSLPVNTALTAFIAAFQDAKEGRPNAGAIQACIFLVMGTAAQGLTAEHLAELQGLMDGHHLSSLYTLQPPP